MDMKLRPAGLFTPTFECFWGRGILTNKLGQTHLVFGLRSGSIVGQTDGQTDEDHGNSATIRSNERIVC